MIRAWCFCGCSWVWCGGRVINSLVVAVQQLLAICRLGEVWWSADGCGTSSTRTEPMAVCSCTCRQCRHVCRQRFIDSYGDGKKWWQLGRLWRRCHKQCHCHSVIGGWWLRLGGLCQFWLSAVSVLFHQVMSYVQQLHKDILVFILYDIWQLTSWCIIDISCSFILKQYTVD